MHSRVTVLVCRVLALAFAASIPMALAAQDAANQAVKANVDNSVSKWDIFLGYSYLAPNGRIASTRSGAPVSTYGEINWGGILSVSRYFNKNVGVQFEGDAHTQSEDWPAGDNNASYNSNDDFAGGSAGLIYRIPTAHFTPFLHVLGGAERVGSIYAADSWHPMVTAGGGLDYNTPLFNHHLAIRIFQADYQFIYVDPDDINAFRLSTGAVWHFGSFTQPPPVTLACSVSPVTVFAGDPVTVAATAGDLNPKYNAVYSWTGTGVTGSGTTATVATASLAAGTYTVTSEMKEGRPGREGLRPGQTAHCSATFTVKDFEPPTVSCSASPATIKPGDTSTVSAIAMSPQNRPLTFSYASAAGTISGTGTTAVFSSTGAPTGDVAITCNVSDDKGQTATSNTAVSIVAPIAAAAPHTEALCSVSFERDAKHPTRVDNEAKACLDSVALSLQKQSAAKVVLVGESTANEKVMRRTKHGKEVREENLAAERAVNVKEYLVIDKGIDASRIIVATGNSDGQSVETYQVPAEANFGVDVQGTTSVDETQVKAQVRKPLPERHAHK